MTDIFEEVDQSLREDRIGKLWKKYSIFVYAAIVIAIGGVGVFEFMKSQRAGEVDAAARIYESAFVAASNKDLPTARKEFEAAGADSKAGFGILSGHMLAGIEQELTADPDAVAKHLSSAAAADKGIMGDIAVLKLAYLKADTAKIEDLEAILKPLLDKKSDEKNYTSSLARELIASKALANGDVERARDEFEALQLELNSPQGMKERVRSALMTMPPRPVAPAATAPATPAPAAPAATPAPSPTPAKPQ